jgi:nicotinamidase-related amidase
MAGWDAFLTEQDKQHLAIWGKKANDGFGERPVLLVVDVFHAALGHERKPILESIRDWPMSCGLEGWEAVDRMVGLIAAARANGVPVIHARALAGFPSDWFRRGDKGDRRNRAVEHLPPEIRALANEFVPQVAPLPGELVIEKVCASVFAGTPLLHHLRAIGADTVIVCGESTSGCVRAAVVDAVTYRYRVGVVGECCFDRTQASHWMNLFDMHQKYADVIDMAAAVEYFVSTGVRPDPHA